MPEAFSEAEELKAEIRRLRPEWLLSRPRLAEFNRYRYDWLRKTGGFWSRARYDADREATHVSCLDGGTLEKARDWAYCARQGTVGLNQRNADVPLNELLAKPAQAEPGWDGDSVEYWRWASLYPFRALLHDFVRGSTSHAYAQWLGYEVDWVAMYSDSASLNRFWLYDVRAAVLRRFWIRSAFEFLQQWHKVSNGTPCDSQLSTYLVESDFVVSADKNFIRFVERCRKEAPFPIARPYCLSSGKAGIADFLKHLESKRLFLDVGGSEPHSERRLS